MNAWLKAILLPIACLGLICGVGGAQGSAEAQTAAPAAPAPAAEAAPAAPAPPQVMGMDFTGYVDVGLQSYSTGQGKFDSTTPNGKQFANARTFDFANDQVQLQNVSLRLNKTPDVGFGGMIDLTLGQDADTIAAYGTIDKHKGPAGGANQEYDITQLYGYYGFNSKLSAIFGKYATHAGQEVITSRDDTNFSRSILFGYAIPFTHTGVRATYKASDSLNLLLGANEGWDIVTSDNNGTTLEFDWEWTASKQFSFFGTYLSGNQQTSYYVQNSSGTVGLSGVTGNRTLVDLLFTYNATDALSFVLNYDSGSQGNVDLSAIGKSSSATATWNGTALYANYGINDNWRTSVRAESFSDPDGYRTTIATGKTTGPTWTEGTVTVAFMGFKNTEIRGEVRSDNADQKIFLDGSVTSKPPTTKPAIDSMTSIGAEVIYKF
jgi:Putative beta-barrel porin-2, OmpL-like. bbp2